MTNHQIEKMYLRALDVYRQHIELRAPKSMIDLAQVRLTHWRNEYIKVAGIETTCAWCQPEMSGINVSDGMCEACKEKLLGIWQNTKASDKQFWLASAKNLGEILK